MNTQILPAERPRRTHKPPEERRAEILRAASRMFIAQGYHAADVQQIADDAGIGKGTVYRFFPTKEALFLATVEDAMQRLTDAINAGVDEALEPFDQIRESLRIFFGFFDDEPETVELFIQERAEFRDRATPIYFVYRERHRDRWIRMLERLIADGHSRVHSVDAIRDTLGDLAYGAILTHRLSSSSRSLRDRTDEILDILMRGIAADRNFS